ncbi:MAG: winged helix-turn-helix domain-containing protein [Dehalococcoidia bacterium]
MSNPIDLGNVSIDRDRFEVWVAGERADLTFVEFELLYQLASNVGKVVTRQDLLLAVWSESDQARDRKLTVHVSRLRKKIGRSRPWRIETVTKRGYVLTNPSQRKQASSSNGGASSGLRIVKTEENR